MKNVLDDFKISKNSKLNRPIYLYSIRIDADSNTWVRYTSWSGKITFDGIEYLPKVVQHSSIKENSVGRLDPVILLFGNLDKDIQYLLNNYNGLKNKKVTIRKVWLDNIDNPDSYDEYIFYIKDRSATKNMVSLTLRSSMSANNRKALRLFQSEGCAFLFGGVECGYGGAVATCDHTFQTCISLANAERFGGTPSLPMNTQLIKSKK